MSPLKRRQFGQLAAATLTSTVIADFYSKALAQRVELSKEIFYEVNLPSASNIQNRENQAPSVELITADVATGNVLSRINQPELSVRNPSDAPKTSRAFYIADSNRLTKAVLLRDKTLVISTVSSTRSGYSNYLISATGSATDLKFTAVKVLGLEKANQTVESLLSLPNNQLLCLIGNEGIPPFTFKTLDLRTGKILSGDELNLPPLPLRHRFANLCQDPKGTIFATETSSEGIPILISMNLEQRAMITGKVKINRLTPFNFEGRPLSNDLKDLNFSPSGQLYALAADNSGKSNALFKVDVKSGKMGLVRKFTGEKFVFSL